MITATDYTEIRLNEFTVNAGVLGLIKLLEFAKDEELCDNKVWYEEGQSLYVKTDFLINADLADLYVRSMVYYFRADTKFIRVFNEKSALDNLYNNAMYEGNEPVFEKDIKMQIDKIYLDFTDMLSKSSFVSGYNILSQIEGLDAPTLNEVKAISKEKFYSTKKEMFDVLHNKLENNEVQEVLIFKEIIYTKLNMFIDGVAFLNRANAKKDMTESYRIAFINPLQDELISKKKKSKLCISCGNSSVNVIKMSFLCDMADDIARKKSYYWNLNTDAYLCPMCAFVCTLAPLGFQFYGQNAVFVNNNASVSALRVFQNYLQDRTPEENKKNQWFKIYNTFTSNKIKDLHEKSSNIQVIIREKTNNNALYKMQTIDKATIGIFDNCQKDLEKIKNIFVKNNGAYINVYQETVQGIVRHQSLYPLIAKLIRIGISENNNIWYTEKLLKIETVRRGGYKMENAKEGKKPDYVRALVVGRKLRTKVCGDLKKQEERDNKVRGICYKLLNAISTGSRDSFMDTVLRVYSGHNMLVPNIFLDCFEGDEKFAEIGYAFLIGLKSEKYEKAEENKEVNN